MTDKSQTTSAIECPSCGCMWVDAGGACARCSQTTKCSTPGGHRYNASGVCEWCNAEQGSPQATDFTATYSCGICGREHPASIGHTHGKDGWRGLQVPDHTGWSVADMIAILGICKQLDSTAWAHDAEPDAYQERRAATLAKALEEWEAANEQWPD